MLSVAWEGQVAVGSWTVAGVAWLVSVVVIVAAVIDGIALRVPNWLTFPMILLGWATSFLVFGWTGLWASLAGTAVGLGLLLPLYAIGGMGAGDVKLLGGIGAWIGVQHTWWVFVITVIVGGVLAIVLSAWRGRLREFLPSLAGIASEIVLVRDPAVLSQLASERKPRAILLPYGIPIAIGCVIYLALQGMLL
jgi:prepilin peptidase CpaA